MNEDLIFFEELGRIFYRSCVERGMALDADKWITLHPNGKGANANGEDIKGKKVLLDETTGQILGGSIPKKLQGTNITKLKTNFGKLKQGKRLTRQVKTPKTKVAVQATSGSATTPQVQKTPVQNVHSQIKASTTPHQQFKVMHKASDSELQDIAQNYPDTYIKALATDMLHDRNTMKHANDARNPDTTLSKGREAHNKKYVANQKKSMGSNAFTGAEQAQFKKEMSDIVKNGHFAMRTKTTTLPHILDSWFKNDLEIGGAHNNYDPNYDDKRRALAKKLYGVDPKISKTQPHKLEKYGYLTNDFDKEVKSTVAGYGDTVIHFKKDNLINNTTFTLGDSFQGVRDYGGIGTSKITDPNLCEAVGDSGNERWFHRMWNSFIKKGGLDKNTYHNRYIELQFHGDVRVTDIESICMTTYHPLDKKTLFRLKALGIMVYIKKRNGKVEEFDYDQIK